MEGMMYIMKKQPLSKRSEKIELLAPAGNLEKAKTAILYGADAVYIGGKQFSLRSRASNFDLEDIKELCDFAHEHGSKVHVTVNIIPHPDDFEGLEQYLRKLDEFGVDAIICASPAVFTIAQSIHPNFELHISTQHSSLNLDGVKFWQQQGADRVVLGREASLEDVREICAGTDLPIEVFIHGGMCISYSGRCVLSNHMTNRDANRGGCAQSCRWKYEVYDGDQSISSPETPYSMSSKDLQAVDYMEDLIKAGAASLKIEGRMKSAYYLATVVSAYRRLIDHIYEYGSADEKFLEEIRKEIAKAENRPTANGFYPGLPDESTQLYRKQDEMPTQEYIGLVLEVLDDGWLKVQVKNRFYTREMAEIFGPGILPQKSLIEKVINEEGEELEVCPHPMDIVKIKWSGPACEGAMLRRAREEQ